MKKRKIKELGLELTKFKDELNKLEDSSAAVGWDNRLHSSAESEGNPLTYAILAYIHEHGATLPNGNKIPARNLLAITARELEKTESKNIQRIILTNISKHGKIDRSKMMLELSVLIKGKIESIMGDPSYLLSNSPTTIKNKGGNTPLIDSGELRQNIITEIKG